MSMDSASSLAPDSKITENTALRDKRQQQRTIIIAAILGVLVLACFITGLVFLLNPNLSKAEDVARIRDVFIIILALESLLIGAVLVILIVQIARLTNLLQNEIKPILDSTNETVNTLRGTTEFLSDNLVEPVIKLNEYIAAVQRLVELLGIGRRKI